MPQTIQDQVNQNSFLSEEQKKELKQLIENGNFDSARAKLSYWQLQHKHPNI